MGFQSSQIQRKNENWEVVRKNGKLLVSKFRILIRGEKRERNCEFLCFVRCWTAVETWSFTTSILDFGEKNNKNEEFYFPEFRILKSQEKRNIKCSFLPSVRWGTLVGAKNPNPQISEQSGSKFNKMSIFWIPASLCSVANPKNSQNFRNNNSWTRRVFPVKERSKYSETFVFRKWDSPFGYFQKALLFSPGKMGIQ